MATTTMQPAPVARPRVVLVGSAFAAAACAMTVLGLMGIYLAQRADTIATGQTWLPQGTVIPLTPGNFMMMTSFLSIFSMALAQLSVRNENRLAMFVGLGMTMLFSVSIINQTTYLYSIINLPIATIQGVLLYAVTGSHLVMVIVAFIFQLFMAFRAAAGQMHRVPDGIHAAAIFWYATVAVYSVIWFAIYVTK